MKRKRTSKEREERKLKKEKEKENQSSENKANRTNNFADSRQGIKTSGVNNSGGRTGHRRTP